eukprot:COSAG01_NODE_150_length_23941_cov_44.277200_17_plen_301_part_00
MNHLLLPQGPALQQRLCQCTMQTFNDTYAVNSVKKANLTHSDIQTFRRRRSSRSQTSQRLADPAKIPSRTLSRRLMGAQRRGTVITNAWVREPVEQPQRQQDGPPPDETAAASAAAGAQQEPSSAPASGSRAGLGRGRRTAQAATGTLVKGPPQRAWEKQGRGQARGGIDGGGLGSVGGANCLSPSLSCVGAWGAPGHWLRPQLTGPPGVIGGGAVARALRGGGGRRRRRQQQQQQQGEEDDQQEAAMAAAVQQLLTQAADGALAPGVACSGAVHLLTVALKRACVHLPPSRHCTARATG